MVSTAATTKACSVSLSRSSGSACGATGAAAAGVADACASAAVVWVKPVATAVPARPAPTRNFRRGIVSSVIAPSPAGALPSRYRLLLDNPWPERAFFEVGLGPGRGWPPFENSVPGTLHDCAAATAGLLRV